MLTRYINVVFLLSIFLWAANTHAFGIHIGGMAFDTNHGMICRNITVDKDISYYTNSSDHNSDVLFDCLENTEIPQPQTGDRVRVSATGYIASHIGGNNVYGFVHGFTPIYTVCKNETTRDEIILRKSSGDTFDCGALKRSEGDRIKLSSSGYYTGPIETTCPCWTENRIRESYELLRQEGGDTTQTCNNVGSSSQESYHLYRGPKFGGSKLRLSEGLSNNSNTYECTFSLILKGKGYTLDQRVLDSLDQAIQCTNVQESAGFGSECGF